MADNNNFFTPIENIEDFDNFLKSNKGVDGKPLEYSTTPTNATDGRLGIYSADQQKALLERQTRNLYKELFEKLPANMTKAGYDQKNNQIIIVVTDKSADQIRYSGGRVIDVNSKKAISGKAKPATIKIDMENPMGLTRGNGKENGFQVIPSLTGGTSLLPDLDAELSRLNQRLAQNVRRDISSLRSMFDQVRREFNTTYAGGAEALKEQLNEEIRNAAAIPGSQIVHQMVGGTTQKAGIYAEDLIKQYLDDIQGRKRGEAFVAIMQALKARNREQASGIIKQFTGQYGKRFSSTEEALISNIDSNRHLFEDLVDDALNDMAYARGKTGTSKNSRVHAETASRSQDLRYMPRSAYNRNGERVLYASPYRSTKQEASFGIHRGADVSREKYNAPIDAVMPVLRVFQNEFNEEQILDDIEYLDNDAADALSTIRQTRLTVETTLKKVQKRAEKIAYKQERKQGKISKDLSKKDFYEQFEARDIQDNIEYYDAAVQNLLFGADQVKERGLQNFINIKDAKYNNLAQSIEESNALVYEAIERLDIDSGSKVSAGLDKNSVEMADSKLNRLREKTNLMFHAVSKVSTLDNIRKGPRLLEDLIDSVIGEHVLDIGKFAGSSKKKEERFEALKQKLETMKNSGALSDYEQRAIDMLLGNGTEPGLIDFTGYTDNRAAVLDIINKSGKNKKDRGGLYNALGSVLDLALSENGNIHTIFDYNDKTGDITTKENAFYRAFSTLHQNNEYRAVNGGDLSRPMKSLLSGIYEVDEAKRREFMASAKAVVDSAGPSLANKKKLAQEQSYIQQAIDTTQNAMNGVQIDKSGMVSVETVDANHIKIYQEDENGNMVGQLIEVEDPDEGRFGITNFDKTAAGKINAAIRKKAEKLGVDADSIMVAYDWRTAQDRAAGHKVMLGEDERHGGYVEEAYLPGVMFKENRFESDAMNVFRKTLDPTSRNAMGAARYDLFPELKNTWFAEGGTAYEDLTSSKTEGSFEAKLLGMDPKLVKKYEEISNGAKITSAAEVMRAYASVHGSIGGEGIWDKLFNPKDITKKRLAQLSDALSKIGVKYDKSKESVLAAMKNVFTIGTKENNALVDYAKQYASDKNININEALTKIFASDFDIGQMVGARPPYSHGLGDIQHSVFFMDADDEGVKKGDKAMRISLGSQLQWGADFDGDIAFFLGAGTDENRRKAFNLRSGSGAQQRLREYGAAIKASALESGLFKTLTRDDSGLIVDSDLIRDASSRQRAEKVKTGNLANLRGTMSAYINSKVENGEALDPNLLVAHMFFEGLAQDTISSKKVINKLMQSAGYKGEQYTGGEMTKEQEEFYEQGLNNVNALIDNIYSGKEDAGSLFTGLQKMGLVTPSFDENGKKDPNGGRYTPEKLEIIGNTILSLSEMARGSDKNIADRAMSILDSWGVKSPVSSMEEARKLVPVLKEGVTFESIGNSMRLATSAMGGQSAGNNDWQWIIGQLLGPLRDTLQPEKREATSSSIFYGNREQNVLSVETSMQTLSKVVDGLAYKLSEIIGLLTKSGGIIEKIGGTAEDRREALKRYGGDAGSQHMAHAIASAFTAPNRNYTVYGDKNDSKFVAQSTFGNKEKYEEFQKLTIKRGALESAEKEEITKSINDLSKKEKDEGLIEKLGLKDADASKIENELTILRGSYIGALDAYLSGKGLDYKSFDINSVVKKNIETDEEYQLAALHAHYSAALRQLGVEDVNGSLQKALEMAAKQNELREKYGGETIMSEVPLTNAVTGQGTSTADFLIRRSDGTLGFYESKTGHTANITDAEKVQAQVYAALGMTMQSEIMNLFNEKTENEGWKGSVVGGEVIKGWQDRNLLLENKDAYEKFRSDVLAKWADKKVFSSRFKNEEEQKKFFDEIFKSEQGPITSTLGKVGANGSTAVWQGNALTPELAMALLTLDPNSLSDTQRAAIISGITHMSGQRPKSGSNGKLSLWDYIKKDVASGPANAFRMLFRGGVTTRIIFSFISSIKKVIQLTEQLNTSMTNLRIITGKNAEEANSMMKNYNGLADELGVTTAAIAQIGAEWLRQGYNVQETENLIVASTKLAKLGFMDQGAAVKSLTAAMKGFNLSATESMSIVDKLTTLDAKYATTAGDIATAMTRVASVANNAGMSLDETAAAITAIIDTTQQDAGTVGNALKTMLSRYGNVKAGSFAALEGSEDGDSENINDVERVLGALGIQIRTSKMEMRDFADVLDDIAEKWTTLTTVEQNAIAVALGGVRQRNTTVALLNSYQTYKKALEDEENSAGRADRKYEVYKDSIEFQKKQLQAAWEGLVLKIDQSPVIKGVLFSLTNIVKYADRWVPVLISAIPLLRTLVNSRLTSHKQAIIDNTNAENENTAALRGESSSQNTPGYWGTKVKYAHGKHKGEDSSYTRGQIAGITIGSVVSSGMSYGASGGGLFGNMIDESAGTSEFENGADSVISGVTGAAGAGIGAAIGTIIAPGIGTAIGASLGPMLLDPLASLFKWLRHRDEIEMSRDVAKHKKLLDAIQGVSSSVSSLRDSVEAGSSSWSSADWKRNQEAYLEIINAFESNSALRNSYKKLFGEEYNKPSGDLASLTSEEMSRLSAAQIVGEAEELFSASRIEISNLEKDRVKTLSKIAKETDEEDLKDLNQKLASIDVDLKKYQDALQKSYLAASVITSGVSRMSSVQINNATLERVIRQVAADWSKNNPNVFLDGTLTASARQDIIDYLRGDERYSSLFRNNTQTLSSRIRAKSRAESLFRKYDGGIQGAISKLDGAGGYAALSEEYRDSGIDLLYKADAAGIERIAHALNMTTEQVLEAEKSLGWVTDGTIANGIDGLVESFSGLGDILTEISHSSTISAKTMDSILENYSWLLNGENGSFGTENIMKNLLDFFTNNSMEGAIGIAAKAALTNDNTWSAFIEKYNDPDKYSALGLSEEDWLNIQGSSNFSGAAGIMFNNTGALRAFAELAGELTGDFKIAEVVQKILVEAEDNAIQNEISNLESVKESLEDVNKQREKELELIKAKQALENAQKEKIRVYREGVGFVYASDQQAIKEAQENVEKLERERDQQDIQYQIDMLNQQKDILANIEKNEQLEGIYNLLEEFMEGKDGSALGSILSFNKEELAKKIQEGVTNSLDENAKKVLQEEADAEGEAYASILSDLDGSDENSWINKAQDTLGKLSVASVLQNNKSPYYDTAKQMYSDKLDQLSASSAKLTDYNQMGIGKAYDVSGYGEKREYFNELKDQNRWLKVHIPDGEGWAHSQGARDAGVMMYYSKTAQQNIPDDLQRGKAKQLLLAAVSDEGIVSASSFKSANNFEVLSNDDYIGYLFVNTDTANEYGYYKGADGWHEVRLQNGDRELSPPTTLNGVDSYGLLSNALGTRSFIGGGTLINERGLEGIITPEGTITSLPAKSGILPADLTKNLWALGEIAPNLITQLSGKSFNRIDEKKSEDNSVHVGTLNATFNTDSGFDAAAFWNSVKSQTALTKNNH